jgi:general secretion pathway protein B
MSLILDALKKSEAERQRQSGPTLLEVHISQPRRRYPTWVIAVGALLAVNMLLLLAFVLHRPAASQAQAPPAVAASGPTAGVPTSSGAATSGVLPPSVAPVAPSAAMPPISPGVPAPVLDTSASMLGGSGSMQPAPRNFSPPETGGDEQDSAANPADDEPALPPGRAGTRSERDSASHYANLPSFSDVSGDLPDLRLDLHVYAERPRDRYAMINMHRVREGDALPEGPRVLAITREGVALDYRGQEFMLRPQ